MAETPDFCPHGCYWECEHRAQEPAEGTRTYPGFAFGFEGDMEAYDRHVRRSAQRLTAEYWRHSRLYPHP